MSLLSRSLTVSRQQRALSLLSPLSRPYPALLSFTYSALLTSQIHSSSKASSKAQHISIAESQTLLANQRLSRPVSPHLTTWKWQMHAIQSISHRISGQLLSGTFYIFSASYLILPYFGLGFDVSTLASSFADLSVYTQYGLKFTFAFPFVFHCWNGVRHLFYDAGTGFANKTVDTTGYVILGLTGVTTLGLLAYF